MVTLFLNSVISKENSPILIIRYVSGFIELLLLYLPERQKEGFLGNIEYKSLL